MTAWRKSIRRLAKWSLIGMTVGIIAVFLINAIVSLFNFYATDIDIKPTGAGSATLKPIEVKFTLKSGSLFSSQFMNAIPDIFYRLQGKTCYPALYLRNSQNNCLATCEHSEQPFSFAEYGKAGLNVKANCQLAQGTYMFFYDLSCRTKKQSFNYLDCQSDEVFFMRYFTVEE